MVCHLLLLKPTISTYSSVASIYFGLTTYNTLVYLITINDYQNFALSLIPIDTGTRTQELFEKIKSNDAALYL